ncbi:MAG: hypothetical protein KIT81_01205 [Alphaproteobacteria bacterium]|nr:hypothetical protein [Alphaproteobacteria bacterium]
MRQPIEAVEAGPVIVEHGAAPHFIGALRNGRAACRQGGRNCTTGKQHSLPKLLDHDYPLLSTLFGSRFFFGYQDIRSKKFNNSLVVKKNYPDTVLVT